ncbi:MAG: hypothetical protein AB8B99_06455 [Phormidesmis sp.]
MPTEPFSPPPEPGSNLNADDTILSSSTAPDSDLSSFFSSRRPTFPRWRKADKPLWPAAALAMLVVAGFVGLKAFKTLTSAPPEESVETVADLSRLPVRVLTAKTGLVEGWVFDEGSVWPVRRRVLNFQASGDITYVAKVDGVELREGDFVSRGQLLATIDARRQLSGIKSAVSIQVSLT